MRFVHLLATAALLTACAEADTDVSDKDTNGETDDTTSDTDTTTADTDVTAETDAGDTDETDVAVVSHNCLVHHGIASSSSAWSYRWHDSGRTGGRNVSVFEYDNDANTATLKTVESWSKNGASVQGTKYDYYRCDADNLYLVKTSSDATTTIAGTPENVTSETIYSEPYLLRPNEPSLGDSWTSKAKGTRTSSNAPDQAIDSSTLWAALEDDIAVSGGFSAMKLGTPDVEYIYWQHGIGQVYFPSIAWLDTHTP